MCVHRLPPGRIWYLPSSGMLCAVWQFLPTFRDNLSVAFSRVKKSKEKVSQWISLPLMMGPISCPETTVRNYHTPHNCPGERRIQDLSSSRSLEEKFILRKYKTNRTLPWSEAFYASVVCTMYLWFILCICCLYYVSMVHFMHLLFVLGVYGSFYVSVVCTMYLWFILCICCLYYWRRTVCTIDAGLFVLLTPDCLYYWRRTVCTIDAGL